MDVVVGAAYKLMYLDCILLIFFCISFYSPDNLLDKYSKVTGLPAGTVKRPCRVNRNEAGMLKCQFTPASFQGVPSALG